MNDMVATNIGLIPKEDYLDIMAMQYGFESYEDLKKVGFEISVKVDDYNKEARVYELSPEDCDWMEVLNE